MKKSIALNFWLFLALIGAHQLTGQYDDIYYDPDKVVNEYEYTDDYDYSTDSYDEETYALEGDGYDDWDDDDYDYYDDYDYQYSSRIRRFHRPYRGFGFYDPCYVDAYYYDPFYGGGANWGTTIYIGFNSFGFSRYNRWNNYYRHNRWHSWNYWNDPWYGYNRWNDPWRNSWGYGYNRWNSPWGYNRWNNGWNNGWNNRWNGYNYCPTSYGRNNYYSYNNDGDRKSYWGSRRTGSTTTSPRGPVRQPGVKSPAEKAIQAEQPVMSNRRPTQTVDRSKDREARIDDRATGVEPNSGGSIESRDDRQRDRAIDTPVERGNSRSREVDVAPTINDRKVDTYQSPSGSERKRVEPSSKDVERSRSYEKASRKSSKSYDRPSRSSEQSSKKYDRRSRSSKDNSRVRSSRSSNSSSSMSRPSRSERSSSAKSSRSSSRSSSKSSSSRSSRRSGR